MDTSASPANGRKNPDRNPSPSRKPIIRDVLNGLIDEMVTGGILWGEALAQFEKLFIERVLRDCGGNVGKTAERMGLHRNTLAKKIRQHRIRKKPKG